MDLDGLIQPCISLEENVQLCVTLSSAEIFSVLKTMHPTKAFGPDGTTARFYLACWHITGPNGVASIQEFFFISGCLFSEFNQTNLVLIPKCAHPTNASQFHLISLCNLIYKLIAKILANRLKPLLSTLVSPFQLMFMPGCQFQNNFVIAAELFHSMAHKRGRQGWFAIKGDMLKAYDRVEWLFLLTIFRRFGFSER